MATLRCGVLGCECQCHRAGRRQPPRLWTPGMDHELTDAIVHGEHPSVIAARMRLTVDSVKWRVKSLGLSLRDGWRSRQEVALVLGAPRRSVDAWMRQGKLRVTRHGSRWTRVADTDLQAFVSAYAGVLFAAETVADPSLRRLAETAALANRRRAV